MGNTSSTSAECALDLVVEGLSFPTGLAFDGDGQMYVAEAGLPFGGAKPGGRIWQVRRDGARRLVIGDLRPPVNGVVFHEGHLYVSEGGHPAGITRVSLEGGRTPIVENMPGPGNYHTNMVAFGPDGRLYFSQGAMTNTGIVGLDSYEVGWLRRLPHACDVPGMEIELAGVNVETRNPLSRDEGARAVTGAFVPFGTRTSRGQRVPAQLPCTAAVMRCDPDGSGLELVAWGLRNAWSLGFMPDGRLLAVDQGADDRGSRPIGDAPDLLYHVRPGAWYGWPDFIGGTPVTAPQFVPERGAPPTFLLSNHGELPRPEAPLLSFPAHSAAVKFDVGPGDARAWAGQILIALFGDERPMTAPAGPRVGRSLARIDPTDWTLHPVHTGALERPIDVRFSPVDGLPYVLDFGSFEMSDGQGVRATPGSGRLWRLRAASR